VTDPPEASFRLADRLVLRVSGDPAAVDQTRREYGPTEVVGSATGDPDVDVVYGRPAGGTELGPVRRGGHKSVRWGVRLGDPVADVLRASIAIRGWPGAFARSLVQGFVVEPLLSVAAARHDLVLLPSAGIVGPDGLTVILGRSRAGKSTIAARAAALGHPVIGDDQVIIGRDGGAWPFPRRWRFYPDLVRTAPGAFRILRPGTRRALRIRGLISTFSRGYVRPSLAVDPVELGGRPESMPRRPARLILLDRRAELPEISDVEATVDDAVAWAADLLAEQRARLRALGGADWSTGLDGVAAKENDVLREAFAGITCRRVSVPRAWDAARAVSTTAVHLGFEAPPPS
jgi:hypothetical protein